LWDFLCPKTIFDNSICKCKCEIIILAQEIVSDYHKNNGKPRCALKIDLMKAYDSVSWDFIVHCLKCFGAPQQFVHWIRVCLTSPRFSIALNGSLVGYFPGKKGLRQGDPISPYLFVLAMEVLSLLLNEAVSRFPRFGFHPRCQALGLTHLCFADDLLIFSAANFDSVKVILDVLKEFEVLSGLKANPLKSSFFCSSISADSKLELLNLLQMSEGKLPVRYLGVPLITSRLSAADCESLVAKFTSRIDSWCSKHLSFAGRLQLISSVLFSIQVFWSSVFILPKAVILLLEQKLNRFLWCGKDVKARAKVSWAKVCVPRREGGLGLKRIEVWNKAAMLRHIWNLFSRAGSLWVAWVKENWLRGRSFWQIPIPQSCSWCWKQLLKLRNLAKRFLSFKVGDGRNIFLWLDVWHPDGCLLDSYGPRVIYDAGSSLNAKLSTIIRNGDWFWPFARSDKIVELQSKLSEVVIGEVDQPIWNCKQGSYVCSATWEAIRQKECEVQWWQIVWHSVAIPKQAFMLWLVFKDAMITRSKLWKWGFMGDCLCPFCRGCLESREHLFFECGFSFRIWRNLLSLCLVTGPKRSWEDIEK
jgi:hypothetical protein